MVVFDLDDTLYDEIDYVHSGILSIGHELQRQGIMAADDAVAFIESHGGSAGGQGFDALAERLKELYPGTGFDVAWMLRIYRCHFPDIKLRGDVTTVLDTLKRKNIVMGIITDGRSVTQRNKIKALRLDDFVSSGNIIISEEVGADKTTPLPFRTIASRNPGEDKFLYFGDNPAKDFRWPNAMGWDTVQIIDTRCVHIHPQNISVSECFQAHHAVKSVGELLQFIP